MRVGCWGCLGGLMFVGALAAMVVGGGWAVIRMVQTPERPVVSASAADGLRAQQKLYEVGRRGPATVTLTEAELNGLLTHHLSDLADVVDLSASSPTITLSGDGTVTALALVPVRELTTSAPLSALVSVLPTAWTEGRVWLSLRARPRIEEATVQPSRRYLTLVVEQVRLGRQRVPAILLRLLLSPGTMRILRWRIPGTIESVTVESRRVVIRTGLER